MCDREPVSTPLTWQIVVPIKDASGAKSRLRPPAGVSRERLAEAMAADTLAAVCGTVPAEQVVVVTSDAAAREVAARLHARVLADPGDGLDAAVRAGLRLCATKPGPVAVLLGDLPALRPQDLRAALEVSARHTRAVVPDHEGTGTVLLTSTAPALRPAFGPGSAARHGEHATTVDLDLPHLRQDVDTAADLAAAERLGLGPATWSAVHESRGRSAP